MMEPATNPAFASAQLNGARVLVVEDDCLIALELAAILTDAGATVIGPAHTVSSALRDAEDETLSAAILDIRLGNETVMPVARLLATHRIPFLFYTGQARTDSLRREWPDCGILSKPTPPNSIVKAMTRLLERREVASH